MGSKAMSAHESGRRCEHGSVSPLIIGIALIGALLLGVLTDSAHAFLMQRTLVRLADSSALVAASSLDEAAYYEGRSLTWMPVDDGKANRIAQNWIRQAASRNHRLLNLRMTSLVIASGRVRLSLAAETRMGFLPSILHRQILALRATASATSRRS